MNISTKSPTKETEYPHLCYDANRDFIWLFNKPWIWIPRLIEIISLIFVFIYKFITQRAKEDQNVQKKLAKSLLTTITKLGPCFIKTGQSLSTRPDLIQQDWLEELINLQDNLPAFDHQQALEILENEIGTSIENVFEYFPDRPIASASLGQVYKAKLKKNNWVAVKIQRPNLIHIIRRDIVIIRVISTIFSPILPLNLGFNLGEIIDEFGISLFKEIDYEQEADNAEKFASLFANEPSIVIPNVIRSISTRKVITTSWIDGLKLKEPLELTQKGINPSSIIRTAVRSGLQQLLEFGYFHADPHPGNIFALKSKDKNIGTLGYVDFGMMDSISDDDRITLTKAIVHLINKDYYLLAADFQKLGFLSKKENIDKLIPVLENVLGEVLSRDVNSFNIKKITDKFSELMYDYPFRVPARFALIIRAVVSQEGLALKLDPKFKILRFAYPYVAKRLLTDQNDEMLQILTEVMFDSKANIRVDRVEALLNVIGEEYVTPGAELIPVARDGIKLLVSSKGALIRKKLLLSLIKDEKINANQMKELLKLIRRTYSPRKFLRAISTKVKTLSV